LRALLASDDSKARFAIELFCYRLGRELGSLAAAAAASMRSSSRRIGEHAPAIRERVCRHARGSA
jgi:acetate kinase